MKQFSCLIKGSEQVAVAAAIARNLLVVKTVKDEKNLGSTFVRVHATESAFNTLVQWLSEQPPMITGHGYPAGTLLHFAGIEDGEYAKPTT